ncbi:unnamed protein product [Urochloa decumbens]|uniref:Exocyst subunit Exo70 family protein n=1 Tax=Urochloa decumbens TaxID=240449 RepID=A0ABC9C0U4_9POAL
MDVDGSSSTAHTGGAAAGAQQPQRPNWRPRPVAFATTASSSSTSGGSLTTTYTSGSSYLHPSSSGDGGLAPSVALSMRLDLVEEREKTCRHIMCLVKEFSAAVGDDEATNQVLERWLSDLGISWVLSIATDDKTPAGSSFIFPRRLGDLARSWIDALKVIQLSISAYQEEGNFSSVPAASEFARFLGSTLLKMLPFADAVVSAKVIAACIQYNLWEAMVPPEEKLKAVIGVRQALSATSERINCWARCSPFPGSRGILEQLSILVVAKMTKLEDAVWDTLDEVRTSIVRPPMDSHNVAGSVDSQALELERALAIHKDTRSIVNCINVISADYNGLFLFVHDIVLKAARLGKYVPQDNRTNHPFIGDPFAMLIMEMISCLQENLVRVSQPFPDQSLRFLFLLNNTHFIWQQLQCPTGYGFELYMRALARKIDEHIQRYLQASWIQVVSGLQDPTPLCLVRYSPLAKFETEFQKTYTVQKLWKIPDPDLRRRLRKAIIETVIPAFIKYLADNKITAPRVTQQELEDMLQDIFEG